MAISEETKNNSEELGKAAAGCP